MRRGIPNHPLTYGGGEDDRLNDGVGYFKKVFVTPIERLETTYRNEAPEGCAHVGTGMSGEIREHGHVCEGRLYLPC